MTAHPATPPISPVDLADPVWFLHALDFASREARFVHTDRATVAAQPFLDHRWNRLALQREGLSFARSMVAPAARPALNFIWHSAYCCSTLIAACLDARGRNLSLKEPLALVMLAGARRSGNRQADEGMLASVLALLGRRFDPAEHVLIKPSNFANNLIAPAAGLTEGRMLMLHSTCRAFLASTAAKGEDGRRFAGSLVAALITDRPVLAGHDLHAMRGLSELRSWAVAWRLQIETMREAMATLGDRAASLDCVRFLAAPREGLEALDGFFELGLTPDDLDAAVAGPLTRDSKTGETRISADGAAAENPAFAEAEAWLLETFPLGPGDTLPRALAFGDRD